MVAEFQSADAHAGIGCLPLRLTVIRLKTCTIQLSAEMHSREVLGILQMVLSQVSDGWMAELRVHHARHVILDTVVAQGELMHAR